MKKISTVFAGIVALSAVTGGAFADDTVQTPPNSSAPPHTQKHHGGHYHGHYHGGHNKKGEQSKDSNDIKKINGDTPSSSDSTNTVH